MPAESPVCPFCGAPLSVVRSRRPYELGTVVRLSAYCAPCQARIDAAGYGEDVEAALAMAEGALQRRIAAREGTRPSAWVIVPRRVKSRGFSGDKR